MNQLTNPRQARGLAILSEPNGVREVRKNHWMVKSQSGNSEYLVIKAFVKGRDPQHRHDWICSSPAFIKGVRIRKVRLYIKQEKRED